MSFSLYTNFTKISARVFNYVSRPVGTNQHGLPLLSLPKSGLNSRVISRSLGWYMCACSSGSSDKKSEPVRGGRRFDKLSRACNWNTCCSIHTENDKSLLKFLASEIKTEQDRQTPFGQIKGFRIEPNGAEVKLTRQIDNEDVIVRFNVNHSVNTEAGMGPEAGVPAGQEEEADMISTPSLVVDIRKGSHTLSISCGFSGNDYHEPNPSTEMNYADMLSIEEVSIHNGEWSEEVYSVSNMDDNLYNHFLAMLEDRGIDENFVEELVNYSTAFEHALYVDFLRNLEDFIKK